MLNENDIADYTEDFSELQPDANPKKLHDLPRGSYFKIDEYEYLIKFHKTDGAYSYNVIAEGPDKGSVVHLAVWAPVVQWK